MESPLMGLVGVVVAALLYHTCVTAQNGSPDLCFADNELPYDKFATKTPYSAVSNMDDSEVSFQGCRPAQFWMTARHGTRHPGDTDIVVMSQRLPLLQASILNNYEAGRSELCPRDLDNIREWSLGFDITMENKLTQSGQQELFDLARRYRNRFPSLLGPPYSPSKHKFLTTAKQRAMESGKYFARGLFGDQQVVFPKPQKPDPLLQFYKSCDKWKSLIDDSEESRKERYKFQNSTHMLDMISNISRRLGFEGNISYNDVRLMYDICRYDKSREPDQLSPWCAVFTDEDLTVIEFDMDLEYFWVDSYGYPLNYEQACPKVKDFIDKFSAVRAGEEDQPLASLYFSHLGGVLKFITRLGIYNDTKPLLAADFGKPKRFKSSVASAFASNVVMVLFECADGYSVATYVQEHPTQLPGCGNQLCPLDVVVALYKDIVDGCDVDELCSLNGGWLRSAWNTLLWGLPALSMLV